MTDIALPAASAQDGSYPRPQLMRARWADLDGSWDFAIGAPDAQPADVAFDRSILVPFPPESASSGLGEAGMLHSVWYRRLIERADLDAAGWAYE